MKKVTLLPNSVLYSRGEQGDTFYIIKSGSLEQESEDLKIKKLSPKMAFGELVLLEKNKRKVTIRSLEQKVELYSLEGSLFREIVKKINLSELKEQLMFLSVIPIFSK